MAKMVIRMMSKEEQEQRDKEGVLFCQICFGIFGIVPDKKELPDGGLICESCLEQDINRQGSA